MKRSILIFPAILIFFSISMANAAKKKNECGKLTHNFAKTCSDLSVNLDLTGCEPEGGNVTPDVDCNEVAAFISYESDHGKYVTFLSKDNNVFKQSGAVLQEKYEIEKKDLSISGFIDLQYQWKNHPSEANGFVVYDGALYFDHQFNQTTMFLDIPFSNSGTADANFKIAQTKAQAYFVYSLKKYFSLMGGQFDTIYGYELNDSKDLFFTNPGLVFGAALPTIHTGTFLKFERDWLTMGILASNSQNKGIRNGLNQEYGFQLGFTFSNFKIITNALYEKDKVLGAAISLIDILIGWNLGPWTFDLEFDLKDAPLVETGWAILLHNTFELTKKNSLGLRLEHVWKMNGHIQNQGTIGFKRMINSSAALKIDYSYNKSKAGVDVSDVTSHLGNIAMVYTF